MAQPIWKTERSGNPLVAKYVESGIRQSYPVATGTYLAEGTPVQINAAGEVIFTDGTVHGVNGIAGARYFGYVIAGNMQEHTNYGDNAKPDQRAGRVTLTFNPLDLTVYGVVNANATAGAFVRPVSQDFTDRGRVIYAPTTDASQAVGFIVKSVTAGSQVLIQFTRNPVSASI